MPVARANLSRSAVGILETGVLSDWFSELGPVGASSVSLVSSRTILAGAHAKSCHQGCKPWPVFLTHGCELHPYAATRFHMLYDGIGTDLAFLHEEVEINESSNGFDRGCLQEKTSQAYIQDRRNVGLPVAVPVDPNVP